jgi:hypothetical protein
VRSLGAISRVASVHYAARDKNQELYRIARYELILLYPYPYYYLYSVLYTYLYSKALTVLSFSKVLGMETMLTRLCDVA